MNPGHKSSNCLIKKIQFNLRPTQFKNALFIVTLEQRRLLYNPFLRDGYSMYIVGRGLGVDICKLTNLI